MSNVGGFAPTLRDAVAPHEPVSLFSMCLQLLQEQRKSIDFHTNVVLLITISILCALSFV